MTFERFDVVVVPFPFTDSSARKRRPALILSAAKDFNARIAHSVMAMITSAKHSRWPLDVPIADLNASGLGSPSVVRMKLFTLDHRFVLRAAGRLGPEDRRAVSAAVSKLLGRTETSRSAE